MIGAGRNALVRARRNCPTVTSRLLLAASSSCMLIAAPAQEADPISAERPGFSSSPLTLARSTWQLEVGYQFTRDRDGVDIDDHTLPLMLLRIGLADRLEMQVNWAGVSWTDLNGRTIHGANDASIGVKWQLTDRDVSTPIGVFAGLSLPVGADEFTSDDVDPTFGLFWSHSGVADFFGTVLISHSDDDTVVDNAVGVSFSLDGTKGAYLEYVGRSAEGNGPEHAVNGGMTFLANENLQLDLQGGLGLNDRAADFFVGFGLAHRF